MAAAAIEANKIPMMTRMNPTPMLDPTVENPLINPLKTKSILRKMTQAI